MCFQIVSIDLELRLDLPFAVHVEDRLYEMLRDCGSDEGNDRARKALSRRLVDLISDMVDSEIPRPTPKQTVYAAAIAKALNIEVPAQALFYREAMSAFLSQHAPRYQELRASKQQFRKGLRSAI